MAFNYAIPTKNKNHDTPGLVELASNFKAGKLTTIDPMDPAPYIEDLKPFQDKIKAMDAEVNSLAVTDKASSEKAVAMAAQAGQLYNAISKQSDGVLMPFKDVVNAVRNFCLPLEKKAKLMKSEAEQKNLSWMREQERKRQQDEAKAKADAAQLQAEIEKKRQEDEEKAMAEGKEPERVETPIVIVPDVRKRTAVVTESGTQTLDYEYVATLVNFREISEEHANARLKDIEKALQPFANALLKTGSVSIPGYTVSKQAKLKTRSSRLSQGEW